MSPYAIIAAMLIFGAAVGGAYWQGRQDGGAACEAAEAREAKIATKASDAAASAAAHAISKIEVQRVEITQPVLREIRERTVYRDCKHSPDGLRGINAALTGRAEPAGGGELPAASAP